MKKDYNSPRAERLNFDYTKVVVASGGSTVKGDKNWKQGCVENHPSGKTFPNQKSCA